MPLTISRTIEVSPARRKIGRNQPCYCGSGKKYKKCCRGKDEKYLAAGKETLVSTVTDFLLKQSFFKDLLDKRLREIFGDRRELEEKEFIAVMEAVIFADNYQGQSPFAYFVNHAPLSQQQKKMYEKWLDQSIFSFFQVKQVVIGKTITLKDLLTDKTYLVYEKMGTYQAEPGLVLISRIVPFEDNWIFSGGSMDAFSKDMVYSVKRIFKLDTEPLDQLEYVKEYYRVKEKKDEDISSLSHKQAKQRLQHELNLRGIDFDVNDIDRMIEKKESPPMKEVSQLFASQTTSKEDFTLLMDLYLHVWQSHPKIAEKVKMGPMEKMLIHQMIAEGQRVLVNKQFERLNDKQRQKEVDDFVRVWLDTPQEELEGKSPRQVILEERKKMGNPESVLKYKLSLNPVVGKNDRVGNLYDDSVNLMKKHHFLQALHLFAQIAPIDIPEPFRWWGNVGGCLINLGEMDRGKKFIKKALQINPNYTVAKKNLKICQNPEQVERMAISGKSRLLEALLAEGILFTCSGIENIDLLHDAVVFLEYLKTNKPRLTAKKRYLPFKHILASTGQFIYPDPAIREIRSGRKRFVNKYREQNQFPKVNFLRTVFQESQFIQDNGVKLVLTEKGEAFLNSPPERQFSQIIKAWLIETDWSRFEGDGGFRTKFGMGKLDQMNRDLVAPILLRLCNMKKSFFTMDDLLAAGTMDPLGMVMISILLDKLILQQLLWAGIISYGKPIDPISLFAKVRSKKKGKTDEHRLRVTPFGDCFLSTIENYMKEAIPKNLRRLV